MAIGKEPRHPSFSELIEKPEVSGPEVVNCLGSYAREGWAISSGVVIEVAERAKPSQLDLHNLGLHAITGIATQIAGGRFGATTETAHREAEEYNQVLGYAQVKLAESAINN
jgi:hypothetical protein